MNKVHKMSVTNYKKKPSILKFRYDIVMIDRFIFFMKQSIWLCDLIRKNNIKILYI